MTFKLGVREGALSAAIFGGVMFALVSVDPRVREHVSDMMSGSSNVTNVAPLGARLGELGSVLWSAARHQSMDNAPLVIFATVGIVLTIFMVRS